MSSDSAFQPSPEFIEDLNLCVQEAELGHLPKLTPLEGIAAMERRINVLRQELASTAVWADDRPEIAAEAIAELRGHIRTAETHLAHCRMMAQSAN